MKMKTSKRNVTRVAALSSAMAILGSGAVLPFATAQTPDAGEKPKQASTYVVDTTRDGFGGDANSGWSFVGTACLTPGATGNDAKSCASSVGWNGDPEMNKGWIQLTDAAIPNEAKGDFGTQHTWKNGEDIGPSGNANQRGSALYNTNIDATRGVDIQFEQVQGGGSTRRMWSWDSDAKQWHYLLDPTRGADGIGFYLVDGEKTKTLTKPGSYGAGLGYTQGTADSGEGAEGQTIDWAKLKPWGDPSKLTREGDRKSNEGVVAAVPGVDNGVIGVGLDAFGNFSSKKYGMGYTTSNTYEVPDGIAGYTWEESALATATDDKGKPACVRDIHPGKSPRFDVNVDKLTDVNYLSELVGRAIAGDCSLIGLITVQEKAAQFGETLYNAGFNAEPYRKGRFGQFEGISYWEPRTDVLALRGPGHGIDGYQLLATRGSTGNSKDRGGISTVFGVRSFRAQSNNKQLIETLNEAGNMFEGGGLNIGNLLNFGNLLSLTGLNSLNEDNFDVHPSNTFYRYVRVTVDKKVSDDQPVEVTVSATNTPPKEGASYEENLKRFSGANAISLKSSIPGKFVPTTYKFGFSASTGAGTDVHAIRDVKIRALEGELALEKSVSIAGGKDKAAAGDTLNYSFKVTNTGEAALSGVNVADPIATNVTCKKGGLAPGESTTCSGDHKLTAEDIANKGKKSFGKADAQELYNDFTKRNNVTLDTAPGFDSGYIRAEQFVNEAVAYGFNLDNDVVNGGMVFSNIDEATVPVGKNPPPAPEKEPSIDLVKEVVGETSGYKVGDDVKYKFTITNNGDSDLTDVVFKDDKATLDGGETACNRESLAVGESYSCTGVHKLVDGEFVDNKFVNNADVTGKGPKGKEVKDHDDATVTPAPERGLKLEKVVNKESDLAKDKYLAGDKVPYKFTVTNNGKVDLTNVMVEDAALDAPATCEATDLAVNESTTCEGVHTLTEDEVAQPEFVNVAQAFGEDPSKDPKDPERKVPSNKDKAVVEFPNEALGLVKEVDAKSELAKSVYAAGDKVPYLFTVTNGGNVQIDNIAIEDKALDAPATCDASSLKAGESTQCRGVHTLTEEEAAAGQFRNVATATGTNPNGDPVRSPEDDEIVPTSKNELILDKQVDKSSELAKESYKAGDKVPYLFNVKNNGPVEIHDLVVVDGALDGDAVCESTVLAPGADTNCRGVHTLTEAEAAKGEFLNVAYASGLDPNGNPVNSNEDQEVVPTDVPRGPLASTGASVVGLAGLALASALIGLGALGIRRRNV